MLYWDENEQNFPKERPLMAQTTKKPATKKKKTKRKQASQPMNVVLILLISLAFCLFLLIKLLGHSAQEAPAPSPSPSIAAAPTLPPSTLALECFGTENGYKTYAADSVTAELGLDVSSHQGWIDWNAVAESDVDYVILRAGYRGYDSGSINQDEYFEYNIASATATDLGVGIYFFSQALSEEEAAAEAYTVLSLIEGYEIDYPIYFDWEPVSDETARTATISATEVTACAKKFCQVIEEAGYEAGVYFNLSMANHYYHLYELMEYEFWLAEYQDTPSYPYAIDMWQYTSHGSVPGIDTRVDLNLSFTSYGS